MRFASLPGVGAVSLPRRGEERSFEAFLFEAVVLTWVSHCPRGPQQPGGPVWPAVCRGQGGEVRQAVLGGGSDPVVDREAQFFRRRFARACGVAGEKACLCDVVEQPHGVPWRALSLGKLVRLIEQREGFGEAAVLRGSVADLVVRAPQLPVVACCRQQFGDLTQDRRLFVERDLSDIAAKRLADQACVSGQPRVVLRRSRVPARGLRVSVPVGQVGQPVARLADPGVVIDALI